MLGFFLGEKLNFTCDRAIFIFWNVVFRKLFYKFFYIFLLLEKFVNGKYFLVKKNLIWFPEKCFTGKYERKKLSGSCEKFRNVILFTDYIKFGSQIFDCYILFWIFIFQFHLLKFNFYINFNPYFYNCYFFFFIIF